MLSQKGKNRQPNSETLKGSPLRPRREFLIATINMSWQLAIVVLVPIIGGFKLDQWLGTLPALTMIGFLAAMAGMALVVWRQMQLYKPQTSANSKGRS